MLGVLASPHISNMFSSYHTSAYTADRTVRSMPCSMPLSTPGAAPGAALATHCETPPASPRCSAGLPPAPASMISILKVGSAARWHRAVATPGKG